MIILSNGVKKPIYPDSGDAFFPAWEDNAQYINDHTHGPGSGNPIGSWSISAPSANWAAAPIGGGLYRQTVTLPSPLNYDTCEIWVKDSATGNYIVPSIERIDASNFYVYTNDSSLTYTCFAR